MASRSTRKAKARQKIGMFLGSHVKKGKTRLPGQIRKSKSDSKRESNQ